MLISASSLCLFVLLFISSTEALYIVANGGYCTTYKSTLPGTLITFEKCKLWDPRHSSWKVVPTGSGPSDPVLLCIGDTDICDQVGDDDREYLAKKDVTNVAQQWKGISGDRFTNVLTGPNFCSTAIYNGDAIPDYNEQMPYCSDRGDQIILSFASSRSLAQHFYLKQHPGMSNVATKLFGPLIIHNELFHTTIIFEY